MHLPQIDLGFHDEIEVTPQARAKDWIGYPEGYRDHPGRNHPAFVRELISLCAPKEAPPILFDPQAGVGTSLIEGRRCDLHAIGWDVEEACRALWEGEYPAIERPTPGSIGLIVTSPAFLATNKNRGGTKRQKDIQEKCGSSQGLSWGKGLAQGHLGAAKTIGHWMVLARPVIGLCREALDTEGRLVWIVRDKIKRGEPIGFVEFNARLLQLCGFELLGAYWRRLEANNNYQLRAALHRKTGRPVPPMIKREYALVARRKR